ncbi:hypothetical protein SAZ10_29395 [Mesorhizobium sp. BAC0120]|uniref:hypothetical protein n=1 Tax=Mesorhizobium sp. BAC0120 TaxID=3090670 RepID=UPI00298C2532|nr:hypothetical protein [Mesorhizobium sp. BAC0120]MDW6025883.1 hypothetical protein [Mesorhizobium sp. BAC0120]
MPAETLEIFDFVLNSWPMTNPKRHPQRRSLWGNTDRAADDTEIDARAQTLSEEEKQRARQAYENEARQRAAMYADAAQRAAKAAQISDTDRNAPEAANPDPDEILANLDRDRLLSELEQIKKKNKIINEEKAFYRIALAIQDVFEEAQLDEAQRRQLLTRIFRAFAAPQIVLPQTAPERYADRADRSENAVAFIGRVYQPWLGKGLTQAHLGRLDKQLYMALHNWLRHNPLPPDLDLPKKSEVVSRQVASTDPAMIREARRLETATRRRKTP